jgi:putative ABC transport system ATP-binding protein
VSDPIIKFSNILFSYDKVSNKKVPNLVLNIPKWQVSRGQHTFISGVSGSGKSTLLNLLSGINSPDSGELIMLGQTLTKMSGKQLDAFRAKNIGVIFQQLNLIPYLSVLDNILLAAHLAKKTNDKVALQNRIELLIAKLNLPLSILSKQASELSVGQQQRVAIVRAMVNEPAILIADEPTSALDQQSKSAFLKLLFELVKSTNCTLLFVSHDESLAEQFESVVEMSVLNQAHVLTSELHSDMSISGEV